MLPVTIPGCFAQEKIETIARETYGAASVEYLPQAEKQIELYTRMGFAGLPICMAKTQYSFSADAAAKVHSCTRRCELLFCILCRKGAARGQ